jgi:uncharacterized membrane protein YgcG
VRKTHGFKIGPLFVVIYELLVELRTRLAEGLANALRHNQHQGRTATNTQGMVDCTVWMLSNLANGAAVRCHVSSTRAARMRTVANRAFCPTQKLRLPLAGPVSSGDGSGGCGGGDTTGDRRGGEGDRAGGGC